MTQHPRQFSQSQRKARVLWQRAHEGFQLLEPVIQSPWGHTTLRSSLVPQRGCIALKLDYPRVLEAAAMYRLRECHPFGNGFKMQEDALTGRSGAKQRDRRVVLQAETHGKLALVGLQGEVWAREGTRLHVDRQEIVKAGIRHIEMVVVYTTRIPTSLPY
ncbi:MAG: hypothetical protein ACJ788_19050 [Ktedonobacteraceae bacterium]